MDDIQRFEGGFLLTNAYLIPTPGGGHLLVDAPMDTARWLNELGITPAAMLLTHQHFDHVMDAAAIAAKGVPVYAWSPFSRKLTLEDIVRQWGMPFDVDAYEVNHLLGGTSHLELEGVGFDLFHVPGHSPDSVVFHQPERQALFAGDTLFAGSTGRADFPGGDLDQLCRGIAEKLYPLPDDTRVFPGHGPATTIGTEKKSNGVVRAD